MQFFNRLLKITYICWIIAMDFELSEWHSLGGERHKEVTISAIKICFSINSFVSCQTYFYIYHWEHFTLSLLKFTAHSNKEWDISDLPAYEREKI